MTVSDVIVPEGGAVDPSRLSVPDGRVDRNPPSVSFWSLVAEDFTTHGRQWASQGFWALFWHRFGNARMGIRPRWLRPAFTIIYLIMFKLSEIIGGISLPYSIPVGRRVKIEHFGGIIISARGIGDDVIIRQNTTLGIARTAATRERPLIGSGVDIGVGAVILGAVNVGDGAVIGANAVVLRDVPAGGLAVGIPARIIRRDQIGAQR